MGSEHSNGDTTPKKRMRVKTRARQRQERERDVESNLGIAEVLCFRTPSSLPENSHWKCRFKQKPEDLGTFELNFLFVLENGIVQWIYTSSQF